MNFHLNIGDDKLIMYLLDSKISRKLLLVFNNLEAQFIST